MAAMNRPTPASLQEYLQQYEKPARNVNPLLPPTEKIFRYGAIVGSVIQCHASLDRAMDQARRHISNLEESGVAVASGTVILADSLMHSKGRFTRSWHAPIGGLWGCLILADTFQTQARTLLPMTLGIACCEAVRGLGVTDASVRWVNDVLVNGRKLAGFLVESFHSRRYDEGFHLLGFGININNSTFPAALSDTAVSLSQLLDSPVNLHTFTLSFLAKMIWNIGLLCYEEEELQPAFFAEERQSHLLLEQWRSLSDTLGRRVLYGYDIQQKPLYEARVTDIQADGAIVMQLPDGTQIIEHGGELQYL